MPQLNAMKWDNWKPSKYAVLCEKHFTQYDYVKVEGWESLKSTSKPNLYHQFSISVLILRRQLNQELLSREKQLVQKSSCKET